MRAVCFAVFFAVCFVGVPAGMVRVTGPGRGTRRAIAKAAAATRPHRARRYRLAFDHGWVVVDEYELNHGTPAGTTRAIVQHLCSKGMKMSQNFVVKTLRRYFHSGDPTQLGSGGCTRRRANLDERVWIEQLLRADPDLFFFEVHSKFLARWRWAISDTMISQAIHFHGVDEDDEELTYKALEKMARQHNEELRWQCLEALTGPGTLPECYVVIDESSLDRRTLWWRRGWAPRGLVSEQVPERSCSLPCVYRCGRCVVACAWLLRMLELAVWVVVPVLDVADDRVATRC